MGPGETNALAPAAKAKMRDLMFIVCPGEERS